MMQVGVALLYKKQVAFRHRYPPRSFVPNHGTAVDGIDTLCRMESATRCGMESMHSVTLNGIKSEEEGDTRQAVMPYAQRGNSIQFAKRIDTIHKPFGLE